ncbi:MAG: hypothetical protein WC911_06340 [Thermoleophilia bacterium]
MSFSGTEAYAGEKDKSGRHSKKQAKIACGFIESREVVVNRLTVKLLLLTVIAVMALAMVAGGCGDESQTSSIDTLSTAKTGRVIFGGRPQAAPFFLLYHASPRGIN